MSETITRSFELASETMTVGVLSFVIPSDGLTPESELDANDTGRVADGAVVSIVIVNCSDAATMSPAINCRAR